MSDKKLKITEGDDNTVLLKGVAIGAGLSDDGKLAITAYVGGKHLIMPIGRNGAFKLIEILQLKLEDQRKFLP